MREFGASGSDLPLTGRFNPAAALVRVKEAQCLAGLGIGGHLSISSACRCGNVDDFDERFKNFSVLDVLLKAVRGRFEERSIEIGVAVVGIEGQIYFARP